MTMSNDEKRWVGDEFVIMELLERVSGNKTKLFTDENSADDKHDADS